MCESAKVKAQFALLHDDDEDVFATSLINRYLARPEMLQDMCLATFTVTFDVASMCLATFTVTFDVASSCIGDMNNCDDEIINGVACANGSSSNNNAINLD